MACYTHIVGAEMSGASAAFHLHQSFPQDYDFPLSITMFETSANVGGRNRCITEAAEKLGLEWNDKKTMTIVVGHNAYPSTTSVPLLIRQLRS
jgi:protoporphyrinogen oxidase